MLYVGLPLLVFGTLFVEFAALVLLLWLDQRSRSHASWCRARLRLVVWAGLAIAFGKRVLRWVRRVWRNRFRYRPG